MGHRAQNRLHKGRLAAAVRADDTQKVVVRNLQIDVLQGFVAVVCDADVV